ncbi:MAG: hypothetical protein R2743_24480 [Ilumatobacteraceae bacterium]
MQSAFTLRFAATRLVERRPVGVVVHVSALQPLASGSERCPRRSATSGLLAAMQRQRDRVRRAQATEHVDRAEVGVLLDGVEGAAEPLHHTGRGLHEVVVP